MADDPFNSVEIRDPTDGTRRATVGADGALKVAGALSSIAAGETHLGEVGGKVIRISDEVTRPADTAPYVVGDVINDATSGSTLQALTSVVRVSTGSGYITKLRLATDKKDVGAVAVRVHFFRDSVTSQHDNAPFIELYASEDKYLGYVDLDPFVAGADTSNSTGAVTPPWMGAFAIDAADTSVHYILETRTAFTPASGQKFKLYAMVDAN